MELRISLCVTLFCLIVVTFSQLATVDQDGQRCTTQDECPDGMCCVHNPLNPPDAKKRFILDNYQQHDHGFCRRARKFNESCWPLGHDAVNPKLYDYFCPCVTGLECRGLIVHETSNQIIHRYPVCQDPESNLIDQRPTPSGEICFKDADCGTGMCCVLHPLTRRQQNQHGYCRNLRKLNESCDIDVIGSFNDFQCPCEAGLVCKGTVVHHFTNQTVHENTKCQTS
ncbi:hypothetical protein ACF0H5_014528 [Mactra antiquata]